MDPFFINGNLLHADGNTQAAVKIEVTLDPDKVVDSMILVFNKGSRRYECTWTLSLWLLHDAFTTGRGGCVDWNVCFIANNTEKKLIVRLGFFGRHMNIQLPYSTLKEKLGEVTEGLEPWTLPSVFANPS